MEFIKSIAELGSVDLPIAGGKAANLGELMKAGMPVPNGFVIITEGYRAFMAENQLDERLHRYLTATRMDDPASLETASNQIQGMFRSGKIPTALATEIRQAYINLGSFSPSVAVRSSATAEDLPDLSFAGQMDTYLNVLGEEALLDATGLGGYYYYGEYDVGGGVFIVTATATLVKNNITSNNANQGGGVYLGNSDSQFNDNTISDNVAINGGGGMFLYKGTATLFDNEISDNTSYNYGGGLYLFYTDATLRGNRILRNRTDNFGGGVDVASCSSAFNDNVVSGNSAKKGGGIYLWYSQSKLTNNVIADNQGNTTGSGLYLGGSNPILLHTTLARNQGGDGSGVFVSDDGSTVYGILTMTNTILVTHTVGISVANGNTANINGILWFSTPLTISQVAATVTVQHQYTGDPAFNTDGYHLTSISAAREKGNPTNVLADIDGEPRVMGNPDLGVDEYWPPGSPIYCYLPVIKRNP